MPIARYKVRVTKDYLVFCSGHFITFAGDQCERIHGHNYRVAVEVEDDLDENHYVFDFIALHGPDPRPSSTSSTTGCSCPRAAR